MKKRDIVARVASEAGTTKQAAEAAVRAVFASVAEALARGEDVAVAGFGRFVRTERPAREGRNTRSSAPTSTPQTISYMIDFGWTHNMCAEA